jgi:hypothetical protein
MNRQAPVFLVFLFGLAFSAPVATLGQSAKEPAAPPKTPDPAAQSGQNKPDTVDPLEALFQPKIQRLKNALDFISNAKKNNKDEEAAAALEGLKAEATELTPFLQPYLDSRLRDEGYRFALSSIEEKRWDKQAGTTTNSAGSTSVASKGSVSGLLSFAVENGALTRSVSGTTVTFRGSPANIYSALAKGNYIAAGPAIPKFDGSFASVAKRLSFHVAFDTSRGNTGSTNTLTADSQQLSGWGLRYDILNKRDPRRPEYASAWNSLMDKEGLSYINRLTKLSAQLEKYPEYRTWKTNLEEQIAKADPDKYLSILEQANTAFQKIISKYAPGDSAFEQAVRQTASDAASFAVARGTTIDNIMRSWTVAAEFNVTKQANTNGTVPTSVTSSNGSTLKLPDLGNLNLVVSKGFTDGPELTLNAGFTWFQNAPSGVKASGVRDAQVSAELDVPLREIQNIGKPTFTLAGQFLSLLQQPLGQQVLVNNVAVTTKGNIGLVQGKLTIPTKSAGISIPLSITWASRTELIKESDVRGNIGISFDLEKLFAKP